MNSLRESPSLDRRQYRLDPEARQALGNLSPELAWLQIKTAVSRAIEYQFPEADKARQEANFPVDLRNLMEVLEVTNPVRAINNLVYRNPRLNLQTVEKFPLEALKAVLRMLTSNDRWTALKP